MSNENEINEAIKLLQANNYIVTKMTPMMIEDADECEAIAEQGRDKDCCECSCFICAIQPDM